MNTALANALKRQKDEKYQLIKLAKVARPEAINQLSAHLESPLLKVIIGPRRAGKSTLAVQALADTAFAYVNLEDEAVLGALSNNDELIEALDKVYPRSSHYLLDEIQNLPDWELFLNRQHRRGKNLIVTGSNSKLLGRELSTSLTGRHLAIELLPFSFSEFVNSKPKEASLPEPHYESLCNEWLQSGGFPDVVLSRGDRATYLRTLFDSILLRDVVQRHKIRNVSVIRGLSQLLINSISSRFTARSLERALKQTSFNSIRKYIDYFQEAYLFFELQPFSLKAKQRIAAERKIFTVDNGFVSSCARLILGGESILLENLVFVEQMRRGAVPNLTMFYIQTKNGLEVDFFLPEAEGGPLLRQVSHSIGAPLTLEREVRALLVSAKEYNAKQLQIITMSDEAILEREGFTIEVIPLWKWALESG